MRYCQFKSYMHGDPPAGWDKEYYSPMIGDNDIYNQVPLDGTSEYLLSPSLDLYDSAADAWDQVWETLGDINPAVSFGLPYASEGSYMDNLCGDLSYAMFNGVYLDYPYWKYYSPTPTSDEGVGNINPSGTMLVFAFNYVGGEHAAAGDNYVSYGQDASTAGITWNFAVFPYDMFRGGVFDFSKLKEATEHPGDQDWRRYCNIQIRVFQYLSGDDQDKWQAYVQISGYDKNILTLNDFYQGTKTKVYDNGKPLPDTSPKDEPPGSGNRKGDDVPFPSLPSSDMTSAGSLRIYTLSAAQVKQVFDYLHSHDPAAAVLKWWSNPMQAIISLHYLPYAIKHNGATEEFQVLGTPTGITGFQPAVQFQEINFKYVDLELDSGSYLDYSPYTKVSIYLPGIGIRELNTDDVMGKRVWVKYQCDNATGQFVAFVGVGNKNTPESKVSVRYTFSGQVAASFPITQENWGNTYIAGATLAAGALAMGVTAGAAAAAGGGAAAGEAAGTAAGAAEAGAAGGASAANVAGGAVSIGNSLSNLAKPSVSRSGAVSGATSLFAVKKPYLIIEAPDWYDYKDDFAGVKGWPYGLYQDFSKLKGYAVIEGCHLHNIIATVGELNEIEALLKSGVIF